MGSEHLDDITSLDEVLRHAAREDPGLYLAGLVNDQKSDPPKGVSIYSRSVAVAVVDALTGVVLAWDGWYQFDDTMLPSKAEPAVIGALESLAAWDDAPHRGLVNVNLKWMGTEVGRRLLQWNSSPSMTAARLIASRSGDNHPLTQGTVVAALPLHDEDLWATVTRCNREIAGNYSELWRRPLRGTTAHSVCKQLGIDPDRASSGK